VVKSGKMGNKAKERRALKGKTAEKSGEKRNKK